MATKRTEFCYWKSSSGEPKHEISREEFLKLLGESGHCASQIKLGCGLCAEVADYGKAEVELRKAKRSRRATIWSCGSYTLYLQRRK